MKKNLDHLVNVFYDFLCVKQSIPLCGNTGNANAVKQGNFRTVQVHMQIQFTNPKLGCNS